jgi:hypothetical protein
LHFIDDDGWELKKNIFLLSTDTGTLLQVIKVFLWSESSTASNVQSISAKTVPPDEQMVKEEFFLP